MIRPLTFTNYLGYGVLYDAMYLARDIQTANNKKKNMEKFFQNILTENINLRLALIVAVKEYYYKDLSIKNFLEKILHNNPTTEESIEMALNIRS